MLQSNFQYNCRRLSSSVFILQRGDENASTNLVSNKCV
ncbi:hypothetical protein GAP32_503A [Cronobacter phage vB_CsaM_GAP32]|uniref:Uncharacterized protein n=1 Tax=Cronobacter phage vB_CsaM_GAP32 TaxID=1141136 RepID=K4F7B4_9CAUD|nr:hypothetical protein GAP32_503A [Cronobacter phage vB_CsaM_GAP32]AFC21963.1 hypothetical protein GAP32_503A [Cronobacter phage vB_CsaM_GAP32]